MYRNGDAHALPSVFHSGCTEEMVCFDGTLQTPWIWMCTLRYQKRNQPSLVTSSMGTEGHDPF